MADDKLLTREEWKAAHPRMSLLRYPRYAKEWNKKHNPQSDDGNGSMARKETPPAPVQSADNSPTQPPQAPDEEKTEVSDVGIIDRVSDTFRPKEDAAPIGNVDRALMDAQAKRQNFKNMAAKLSERMKGVDDGVVGADVFMETVVLCGDLLKENTMLIRLCERVYERGKIGIMSHDETGKKFKQAGQTGSLVINAALKEE